MSMENFSLRNAPVDVSTIFHRALFAFEIAVIPALEGPAGKRLAYQGSAL